MLDLTKPVQTIKGTPIEILTTRLMGSYSVLGKTQSGNYYLWKRDGSCLPDGYALEDDLENVPEKREVWLNVYNKDIICLNRSRKEADNNKSEGRVARIKVILKHIEGRFDE